MLNIRIRAAKEADYDSAMRLAWKVFTRFDAKDYSQEGIRNFYEFVTDKTLYRMFRQGSYQMFVALDGDQIVGMITVRNGNHISLLFVDEMYHRNGIGQRLVTMLAQYLYTECGEERMTVNASPYAIPFYHKIGFRDLEQEKQADGIRYTPMEFFI